MPLVRISATNALANVRRRTSLWPDGRVPTERLNGLIDVALDPTFTIQASDRVMTVGSCFAREIEKRLALYGFELPMLQLALRTSERQSMTSNDMVNKYTAASIVNELVWAFGEAPPPTPELQFLQVADDLWHDPQLIHNMEPAPLHRVIERRAMVEAAFRRLPECRLIVVTMGLAEAWFDHATGLHLNGTPPSQALARDPDRFSLDLLAYEEILDSLERMHALVTAHGHPEVRFLITVSPVPFKATFTGSDAIQANTYSKAVQRAAVEAFTRRHPDVDYFPSFEIVTLSDRALAFQRDNIHVTEAAVSTIMDRVLKRYCPDLQGPEAGSEPAPAATPPAPQANASERDLRRSAKYLAAERRYDDAGRVYQALLTGFGAGMRPADKGPASPRLRRRLASERPDDRRGVPAPPCRGAPSRLRPGLVQAGPRARAAEAGRRLSGSPAARHRTLAADRALLLAAGARFDLPRPGGGKHGDVQAGPARRSGKSAGQAGAVRRGALTRRLLRPSAAQKACRGEQVHGAGDIEDELLRLQRSVHLRAIPVPHAAQVIAHARLHGVLKQKALVHIVVAEQGAAPVQAVVSEERRMEGGADDADDGRLTLEQRHLILEGQRFGMKDLEPFPLQTVFEVRLAVELAVARAQSTAAEIDGSGGSLGRNPAERLAHPPVRSIEGPVDTAAELDRGSRADDSLEERRIDRGYQPPAQPQSLDHDPLVGAGELPHRPDAKGWDVGGVIVERPQPRHAVGQEVSEVRDDASEKQHGRFAQFQRPGDIDHAGALLVVLSRELFQLGRGNRDVRLQVGRTGRIDPDAGRRVERMAVRNVDAVVGARRSSAASLRA